MSQGFEIIRARIKDNAAILIDRLMRSKQQEVVLVLPKNSIIAADLNSIKILKEEAESIGKILSLNTENNEIKSFAKKIKMLIYDNNNFSVSGGEKKETTERIKSDKKIKIMMDILPPSSGIQELPEEITEEIPKGKESEPDYNLPPEPVIYETACLPVGTASQNLDLEKNLENFYLPADRRGSEDSRWHLGRQAIFFLMISGFLLFGTAMYLILPKANIKISLKEIPLKVQIPVAVSKNVSSSNLTAGIIPGQYFSLDKTGSKTIEGRPEVGGVIEIYNAYSAAPQKLVANTRFETKDGKIFRIKNSIIIPGAKMLNAKLTPSFIKTEVIGNEASNDYLIGPSYFTIPGFKETPKYAGFYAKSIEPMSIITNSSLNQEAILQNKKELQDKLAQELKTDVLNTLKDSDLQLVEGASSVKVDNYKINANVLSMKVTWQAIFFKEKDLKTMINYFVSNHYPDLKNFTFNDNIAYPEANRVDFKKGELFFTFNVDKNNALPADLEVLKKELAGRDEIEMRTIISDKTYINSAAISLWPFWVNRAPSNSRKINITIDN
ncbi:MAG: hypothetical protein HYV51_01750 [Parcubacteria group bacterium]|nr:hypothetical protein [Parcubacteria group bacterium]